MRLGKRTQDRTERSKSSRTSARKTQKTFEKEAPASTSYKFVGYGDVWLLLEIIMTRYLGKEVTTILEATFNKERKPGGVKMPLLQLVTILIHSLVHISPTV